VSPIDPVTRYLLDAGAVEPDVEGYLDWAAGVIRVRARRAEWDAIRWDSGDRTAAETSLLETATHETLHFLQIVTMGWAYSFALELYSFVIAAFEEAGSFEAVARGGAAQAQGRIGATLARLDEPGKSGLTVRDIMESATVLSQKRMNWKGMDAAGYARTLDDEGVDGEYRAAYDAAFGALGEEAFEALPLLAAVSLCTRRPQEMFPLLLDELRLRGRRHNLDHNFTVVMEAINRRYRDLLLGTAAEAAEQRPRHLVYSPVVAQLNELAGDGKFAIAKFFTRPHELSEAVAVESVRPMIFNAGPGEPTAMHLPDALWRGRDEATRRELTETLVQLHLISTVVMGSVEGAQA
jgi:hypothetical protein